MKKRAFICIAIVLAMCVSLFVACSVDFDDDTLVMAIGNLERELLATEETPQSYRLDSKIESYDEKGNSATIYIKWSIEDSYLITITEGDGFVTVNVPENRSAAIHYKLCATLVNEKGQSYTHEDKPLTVTVSRVAPAVEASGGGGGENPGGGGTTPGGGGENPGGGGTTPGGGSDNPGGGGSQGGSTTPGGGSTTPGGGGTTPGGGSENPGGGGSQGGGGTTPSETTGKGTLESPYTVADALKVGGALADGQFTDTAVYVKGYVVAGSTSQGATPYKGSSGDWKLHISDTENGTTTFYIFFATPTSGITDVKVGDLVVVKGYIENFNSVVQMYGGSSSGLAMPTIEALTPGSGSGTTPGGGGGTTPGGGSENPGGGGTTPTPGGDTDPGDEDYGTPSTDWSAHYGTYDLIGYDPTTYEDLPNDTAKIVISASGIVITRNSEAPVTIAAADLEYYVGVTDEDYGDLDYFYFTYKNVECNILIYADGYTDFYDFEDEFGYYTENGPTSGGGSVTPPTPSEDLTGKGTLESPYTVADALKVGGALANDQFTDTAVYVKGYVVAGSTSQGATPYKGGDGDWKLHISDTEDGTTTFYIFFATPTSGITDVKVGDLVVVNGYIENFNSVVQMYGGSSSGLAMPTIEALTPGSGSGTTPGGGGSQSGTTPGGDTETKYGIKATTEFKANTDYYLGLYNTQKSTWYFFTGVMGGYNDYYYATSDNKDDAAIVVLEAHDGGYYIKVKSSGKYLTLGPRNGTTYSSSSLSITDTATTVWTYDETTKCFTTELVDSSQKTYKFYLGNYDKNTDFAGLQRFEDGNYAGVFGEIVPTTEIGGETNPGGGGTQGGGGSTEPGGEVSGTTVTIDFSTYGTTAGWTASEGNTQHPYDTVDCLCATITIDATQVDEKTSLKSGSWYGDNWRIYGSEKASLQISAKSGYTITSVKITFTVKDSGSLTNNGEAISSNTVITVNGTELILSISTGQARITKIEIEYTKD